MKETLPPSPPCPPSGPPFGTQASRRKLAQPLPPFPAFGVTAVDTTGAGDVFRAGLIYATLQGWPVVESLRFANAAAAASCLSLGAMAGVPGLDEVRRILSGAGRATDFSPMFDIE